jgi:hypothetical protein
MASCWCTSTFMQALLASTPPSRRGAPRAWRGLIAINSALLCTAVQAFSFSITPGPRSLFLQVGSGNMTGGSFSTGGTPGNNATINRVSVTVAPAGLGGGPVAMATDSTVAASPYDGRTFCTVPAQVYVGGFYRTPGTAANAVLSAATPASLVNTSGDTIAFSTVSWISAGASDTGTTIPNGTFAGGASQTLLSIAHNTWFESCLQFSYANAQIVGSGTYTGRVSYTLTAP